MRPALVPIILADPLPWAKRAEYAWDFIRDRARFAGGYRGALANTPNWTFTRASTAYYRNAAGVLIPFGSGVLRTGDRGALIEGAGTNLLTYSQEFDNASWTKSRASVSANAVTAPDGTLTADKLVEDTATGTHRVYQTFTKAASAITYTLSVYIKAAERTFAHIRMAEAGEGNPATVGINLTTGALGTPYGSGITGVSAVATVLTDGWYRVSITGTTTTDTNLTIYVMPATGLTSGDTSYVGDAAKGIYLWGAQLEATAYASSYVPTTTGSATRAADSLTVTGVTGLAYPLTLYAEFERASTVSSWSGALLTVSDGTVAERAFLAGDGSATAKLNAQSQKASAVEGNVSSAATLSVGAVYKGAARFTTNDVNIALSGAAGTADTTATNPTAPTQINFGANVAGANPFYGYIRRLAIFSRALTNAELQALTT